VGWVLLVVVLGGCGGGGSGGLVVQVLDLAGVDPPLLGKHIE